uniref:Carboxyl ester lipase n=1 Tax=Sciurus vulgaris TaxID=55149 RepID=A0A8D2DGE0_SCIVU
MPGLSPPAPAVSRPQLGAVYTEGGFVEGVNKKLSLLGGDSVDIFKGIPYATAKTLENPQRHPGWQGTLKATNFKKRCLQATITQDDSYGDEDCLYLNIWVPQGKKQVSQNLPVMIWIYGGAFLMGAGHGANFLSNYLYDGQEIATRGNVIVVTFNYRVGPLGFLSTGDANLPGNYGLRDQHMAIAWVKRNIAAFGGDPDNITIFGESAGGASVSLQTLSPYNKGLIRRAISQSGVALSPWVIQNDPLFWAKKVAKKVGCPLDDTARLARCLKVTDPRALTMAFKVPLADLECEWVLLGKMGDPGGRRSLLGKAKLPERRGRCRAWGAQVPGAGVVLGEGGDFYRLVSGLTVTKGLRGAQATFNVYTEPWAQDSSQETRKKTVVDLETDILFLMPTEIALAQHRANARSAHTYSYLFSHPSRMPIYPKWVGADHADDLQYIFGKPFATPLGYRPQDRTVSKAMIAYWTNFARSGDPNMGHSAVPTHWYPYTLEDGNYLEITKKMDSSSMKQHLRTRYLKYWTQTYQALPTVVGEGTAPESPANGSLPPLAPPVNGSLPPLAPPVNGSLPPLAPPGQRVPAPPSAPGQRVPAPASAPGQRLPATPSAPGQRVPAPASAPGQRLPATACAPGQRLPAPPSAPGQRVPAPASAPGQRLPATACAPGQRVPATPSAPGQRVPAPPSAPGQRLPATPSAPGQRVPAPASAPVNGSLPPLAPRSTAPCPPLAPPVNGSRPPLAPPVNGSLPPLAPPVNGSLPPLAPPVNGSRPPLAPPVNGSLPPLAPPVNGSLPPLAPPGQRVPAPASAPGQRVPAPASAPGQRLPATPSAPGQRVPAPASAPGQRLPATACAPGQRLPAPPSAPGQRLPATPRAPGQRLPATPRAPGQRLPATPSAPGQRLPATASAPQ